MLRNYLRVAIRNLGKDRAYTLTNIAGLAVGIACCLVMLLYVRDELSYDTYNTKGDRIFRAVFFGRINGHDLTGAKSPAAMGPTVLHDIADVTAYTRLTSASYPVIRYRDKSFNDDRLIFADSSLFEVFSLPLVMGDPGTALTQPNTVVVTESTARKYFGDDNPIGKILDVDKRNTLMVTGVIRDIPRNSHFRADLIGSYATREDSRNPTWWSNTSYTYFLLREGVRAADFERKLNEEFTRYAGPQVKALIGISLEQFSASGNRYGYLLQPLTSIHLHSHLDYEFEANSDIADVYIFSAIAVAILLIACVNFVNLATARSVKRAKEVAVRKTLGSTRWALVGQFMAESVVVSAVAVVLAVALVEVLLPAFNTLARKELTLDPLGDPLVIPLLCCLAVVVALVAGSYPAFYLSSFRPVDVLRSGLNKGGRSSLLRHGLVIFQFTISIALFVGTFVIYSQLQYVRSKDLGFDKEETLVINRANDLAERFPSFENELRGNPDILSLTHSNGIPGSQGGDSGYRLEGSGWDQLQSLRQLFCDDQFAETYRLRMAEGRFFAKGHPSDSASVVVNEEVARAFGVKDIVGKSLVMPAPMPGAVQKLLVIGEVKDFHYQSLHEPIRPLVFRLLPQPGVVGNFLTVRLASGNHLKTLSFLEATWKKYAGTETFSYSFLDDNLQRLYVADQRTNTIAAAFSLFAILVACLGLLGLAAFVTGQRTKEIGIRKVLGSSATEIVLLLSREFARWVLVANVIAWPIAYYVMERWLQNFAYRTTIGVGAFVLSGVLALLIAFITVSSQAIRAARANPVISLKYE